MSGAARPAYRHTQRGVLVTALIASFVVACGVALVPRLARTAAPAPAWATLALGLGVVLASAAVFSSLTVEADREVLRWHFAFGLLRKELRRAEIVRAAPTRTTLIDGIGIHRGPRGWVYNVALGPAVLVVKRDRSAVVLGTDDPAGLVAALAALAAGGPATPDAVSS